MRRLRKTFLVVLTGILLAGSLVTATTIITGNHPDGYELEPELLPSENINATNATLRANLEEMDEVYDAALVYWNLTDTTTGETIRGPAATGFEKGETVEADYVGLEPDAEYTVQAYAEPVVWDDETLLDNWGEKGLSNVPRGSDTAMDAVADSEPLMAFMADSEPAMDIVSDSEPAMADVHSSVTAMKSVWVEDYGSGDTSIIEFNEGEGVYLENNDAYSDSSSTGVDIVTDVDVSDKNKLFVDWSVSGDNGEHGSSTTEGRVYVDGDLLVNTGSEEQVRSVDISGVSGRVNIRVEAYSNAYFANTNYARVKVDLYNLWLE